MHAAIFAEASPVVSMQGRSAEDDLVAVPVQRSGFWHLLTKWTANDIHRKPRDVLTPFIHTVLPFNTLSTLDITRRMQGIVWRA